MALNYLRQYAPQSSVVREQPVELESARSIEELLHGELFRDESGSCFVAETRWGADHQHGAHAFGSLRGMTATQFALVANDPELAYLDLSRAVFLDTETTGLNMGTGTYVFLVGAGYFENGEFRVKQFFLRSPGEEVPFLAALDAFLRQFSVLVTFNGKAFDWPLLENRYIRHRTFKRAPLENPPHVDLLHPARRLWKRRLDSCALSSLEREILRVLRTEDDVPGWLIPSLYFKYLRSGDGSILEGVFYHNLTDILSLATLAIHIDRVVADPFCGLVEHAEDFLCLGKTYERAGESTLAMMCYQESLRRGVSAGDRAECLTRLAAVQKRERNWEAALITWETLIEDGGQSSLHGLVERAKYYEHVERDFMEALDDVQAAMQLAELVQSDDVDRRDLEHRRARLLNRVYRHRSWVGARKTV